MRKNTSSGNMRFKVLMLGAATVASAFFVGIQTAGDVQPISLIEAGGEVAGDINSNGMLDANDVVLILEMVQGYREITPDALRRDPNHDGILTIDDAIRILTIIDDR
jgi:hypothetical protein